MANVLKVQEQDSITHLAAAGWPIRRIARQLGLDRKTVRRHLRRIASASGLSEPFKIPPISTAGSAGDPEPNSPISTAGPGDGGESASVQPSTPGSEPGRPGHCTAHAEFITARLEVERAYYGVPPEYIQREVWARWDTREVRVFNERWEQIALHRRLERGQFTDCLGLGGGHGSLDRQLAYWQGRASALGEPCGRWAAGVLASKGPIGLRSLMGLVALANSHPFRALNDACERALAHGTLRLRDVRALLAASSTTQLALPLRTHHPLIRNLAEYGLFVQNHA